MSAVKVLAAARQTDPLTFDHSEPQLLEAARVHAIGTCSAWSASGVSRSITLTTYGVMTRHVRGDDCVHPQRTWGWSVSTVTSTRGRTTSRHPHGRRRDAGRPRDRHRGARPDGPRPGGAREAAPVRRLGDARRAFRSFATDGRRPADADRPSRDATSRDRARSSLPVPGLRPAAQLVRCASHRASGRRRTDRHREPPLAVPSASSDGACPRRVQFGAARQPPGVQATRWIAVGGPSAAVTRAARSGRSMRPSGDLPARDRPPGASGGLRASPPDRHGSRRSA